MLAIIKNSCVFILALIMTVSLSMPVFAMGENDAASETTSVSESSGPAPEDPIDPSAGNTNDSPSDETGNTDSSDDSTDISGDGQGTNGCESNAEEGTLKSDDPSETSESVETTVVIQETKAPYKLPRPSKVTIKKKTKYKKRITWKKVKGASGYEVQYSRNILFLSGVIKKKVSKRTYRITTKKLKKNKKYFARVRAYKNTKNGRVYSSWRYSTNCSTYNLSLTLITKGQEAFELLNWAGDGENKYDRLQGGCTDGTYYYHVFGVSNVDAPDYPGAESKIAKYRLSDNSLVGVSDALPIGHGNSLSWNPDLGQIVVGHLKPETMRASFVDPNSLTVTGYKDIEIPTNLPGLTQAYWDKIDRIASVTYNPSKKQYICLIFSSSDYIIADENLNPIKYVHTTYTASEKRAGSLYQQQLDIISDKILNITAPKSTSKKNFASVYDMDGTYACRLNLISGYEVESMYHTGNTFYVGMSKRWVETLEDGVTQLVHMVSHLFKFSI